MEKNRKIDRRTLYTRAIIKESFLKLIGEMPYDKINVSKICAESEISRATFYLHYDNIDHVLDAVLDDALLFSVENPGYLVDIVDSLSNDDSILNNDSMLPACQRIADSDKYHNLFMDPLISDHIICRIARHEHDRVIPSLMKKGNLKEDEAEILFRFILNGSFAVNRSLGWQKKDNWYSFQNLISKFVDGGLKSL